MLEKLKHWLFTRGKKCHYCCLCCEYYDLCKAEVMAEREVEENEKL